jgi:hypothetical protein
MSRTSITYIAAAVGTLILLFLGAWFVFLRSPAQQEAPSTNGFGLGDSRSVALPESSTTADENSAAPIPSPQQSGESVFKISDGPVAAATLVQTSHPTTTIARYALQTNGHVFDLVLDSAGAVPHAISNTTIPGGLRGVWPQQGGALVLQYLDGSTVKSVSLAFPTTTASTSPVRIQFLPDDITGIAASPDGQSIAYLMPSSAGTDAYAARPDGSNAKKLFSLAFKELRLSWPSPATLLLSTKSAAGIPGAVFSVSAATGGVVPLLYASGLTATADRSFGHIVYQNSIGSQALTYVHAAKGGADSGVSFNPIPEKCAWSPAAPSTMYCAVPLSSAPADYLDSWHKGAASLADSIFAYDFSTGGSRLVTTPGSDGGTPSDIAELAVSPDERYLVFIKKGDRSLWGVRLAQ